LLERSSLGEYWTFTNSGPRVFTTEKNKLTKKIYIAGPMTGYPLHNFPAFRDAMTILTNQGHHVISPADLDDLFGHDENNIDATIRRDFEAVMNVNAVYMLKGWEKSTGARAEHALAVWRGIEILYEA
jgi:hypothetical protein